MATGTRSAALRRDKPSRWFAVVGFRTVSFSNAADKPALRIAQLQCVRINQRPRWPAHSGDPMPHRRLGHLRFARTADFAGASLTTRLDLLLHCCRPCLYIHFGLSCRLRGLLTSKHQISCVFPGFSFVPSCPPCLGHTPPVPREETGNRPPASLSPGDERWMAHEDHPTLHVSLSHLIRGMDASRENPGWCGVAAGLGRCRVTAEVCTALRATGVGWLARAARDAGAPWDANPSVSLALGS